MGSSIDSDSRSFKDADQDQHNSRRMQIMGYETNHYKSFASQVSPQMSTVEAQSLSYASSLEIATFYVVADTPYSASDASRLLYQMQNIQPDADFVVHLGDIRNAEGYPTCMQSEYQTASEILRQSWAPVFVNVGDNEWNNCPNPSEGWSYWSEEFMHFYDKYWSSKFSVTTLTGRQENYSFRWKGTLFIGVDLPGGPYLNWYSWVQQLTDEVNWVMGLIQEYKSDMNGMGYVGQVVIFAHADPTSIHKPFFDPLVAFIRDVLQNGIPILYMNGDGHYWKYEPYFFGQPSFLRIMSTAETSNPPLKVTIESGYTRLHPPSYIFQYDREPNIYGADSYLAITNYTT